MSNDRFGGSAIRVLLCCKWPTLQKLCLSNNSLDYDWGELPVSTEWPRLRELLVSRCKLSHQAARALSKLMWPCLETLDLCDNHLYDSAVRELVQAPWPSLKSLSLSNNHLQTEGVSFLITGEWPMMEQLYLKNIDLADPALGQLCKAKWPSLKRLEIGQTKMKFGLETMSHPGKCSCRMSGQVFAACPGVTACSHDAILLPGCCYSLHCALWLSQGALSSLSISLRAFAG